MYVGLLQDSHKTVRKAAVGLLTKMYWMLNLENHIGLLLELIKVAISWSNITKFCFLVLSSKFILHMHFTKISIFFVPRNCPLTPLKVFDQLCLRRLWVLQQECVM